VRFDYSFLIRTLNEGKYLATTLSYIVALDKYDQCEIVIVDSGSTDDTLEIAKKYGCKILIWDKSVWSWGGSLNFGIDRCEGSKIIITSGHCYIRQTDFIARVGEIFRDEFDLDAVYGQQKPILGVDPFEEYELKQFFPEISGRYSQVKEHLVGVSNACCVLKRSSWESLKFNESAQSMEDGIWAYEMLDNGGSIIYTSEIHLFHSHELDPEYIYRKWYFRTFSGLEFLEKIMKGRLKYKIKANIKAILLPIFIYYMRLKDVSGFLRFNKVNGELVVKKKEADIFFTLKSQAIYDAHKEFYLKKSPQYWGDIQDFEGINREFSSLMSKVKDLND